MTKFERGCGLTLHHAWKHIEAVQTTDIPLMVEHAVRVMHRAVERPGKGGVGEMQLVCRRRRSPGPRCGSAVESICRLPQSATPKQQNHELR